MEIINSPKTKPTHALFDFDGTISLIRAGWQDIMIPMCIEEIMKCPMANDFKQVEEDVKEFVGNLTGKETIYQMKALVEAINKYGGIANTDLEYKKQYLDALNNRNKKILIDLKNGIIQPKEKRVAGAYELLTLLQQRNVQIYLASGTDEPNVIEEAKLLGVDSFFSYIRGANPETGLGSKKDVIADILTQIDGNKLVVFGDGPVEIEYGKQAGAYCIGLTLNESKPMLTDKEKEKRLRKVKPDMLVRDLSYYNVIVDFLFKGER